MDVANVKLTSSIINIKDMFIKDLEEAISTMEKNSNVPLSPLEILIKLDKWFQCNLLCYTLTHLHANFQDCTPKISELSNSIKKC